MPSTACGKCLMLTVWSPWPSSEVLCHLHSKSQSHLTWNSRSSKVCLSHASRLMASCVVPKSCLAHSWRPLSPLDLRVACCSENFLPELGSKVLHQCLLCVLSHTHWQEVLPWFLREHMVEARAIYQAECVGKSEFQVVKVFFLGGNGYKVRGFVLWLC